MKIFYTPKSVTILAYIDDVRVSKDVVAIPESANYFAFDQNGDMFAYEQMPIIVSGNKWAANGKFWHIGNVEHKLVDFKDTLNSVVTGCIQINVK